MGFINIRGANLYFEDKGDGVPILLIHPAGATASTWDAVAEDLAGVGRVVTYDRRGYARSGGDPVRSIAEHTADAAALLETLHAGPAVVVGTSVGANIAIDLALRRPELVRTVIAYESPWRATRHPSVAGLAALARMGWLGWRRRPVEAAEAFLRWAYTYRDGGTAWDAFPQEWRHNAGENAEAVLADVRLAIAGYPPPRALARINRPVVCAYGERSAAYMLPITRSLARAIPTATVRQVEGAGHAVAFDAPGGFARLIGEAVRSPESGPEA
jgi:pimeloyl-ACP methyl ester carboxylesterase